MRKAAKKKIPITNSILAFVHCAMCMSDRPKNKSPREWAMIEAGWTQIGIQIWCKRHEVNMIHIDFEGVKHLASTNRIVPEEN